MAAQRKGSGNGDQPTTDVATTDPTAVTLRPAQRAFLEMLSALGQIATEDTSNDFAGDDLAGILLAETEEQMWSGDEKPQLNAKVLSGCELDISGFEAKFSNDTPSADGTEIQTILVDPATGRKLYLLVHSTRLNRAGNEQVYRLPEPGDEFVWNTSARYVVAKLFWFWQHGYFNNGGTVKARIQGTDLGAGKSVEKLKDLSAPMVGGQTEQAAEAPF
jgi:hypothetical protein